MGRVIAIVNDKGGVGKTSIAASLGGQFAGAGYRCLLIDLNRQANLADDLGYRGSDDDDQGAGLLGSVLAGTPAREVRPQPDVVCGGARLEDLTPVMVSRLQHRGRAAVRVLGGVLAPIATDYEVVFIDCPPESTILCDLALAAARWVLMPTKSTLGVEALTALQTAEEAERADAPAARRHDLETLGRRPADHRRRPLVRLRRRRSDVAASRVPPAPREGCARVPGADLGRRRACRPRVPTGWCRSRGTAALGVGAIGAGHRAGVRQPSAPGRSGGTSVTSISRGDRGACRAR